MGGVDVFDVFMWKVRKNQWPGSFEAMTEGFIDVKCQKSFEWEVLWKYLNGEKRI